MLWLESLFWHYCNHLFSYLDTKDLDLHCIYHQNKLVSCMSLAVSCVAGTAFFSLPPNNRSVAPVNYILYSAQSCQSGVLPLRDPQGKIKWHKSRQILGTTWPRWPPSQSNWNHIFALTRGFFLSVFALQLSITPCNMTHSALKTIPQAHQGFVFFVCVWLLKL